ncbi:unnamed protein product, partial [Musa banksii]
MALSDGTKSQPRSGRLQLSPDFPITVPAKRRHNSCSKSQSLSANHN